MEIYYVKDAKRARIPLIFNSILNSASRHEYICLFEEIFLPDEVLQS